MKSILQDEKKCFLCNTVFDLHDHHIFFGSANRKISEANGFKVWLCAYHHNMSNYSVHHDRKLDLLVKKVCQRKYEKTHSRDEFIKLIGRSYL